MKLWVLQPRDDRTTADNPWEPWYDKAFGIIVRAASEADARAYAQEVGGDETSTVDYKREPTKPWMEPAYTTCVELTAHGEPGVIMVDMHSA